jgi:hypothetical protein
MNIRPEDLSAIRALGYTETEAKFLYLVATHSGYFTQRQYLHFIARPHGSLMHRLVTRTVGNRHVRATSYAHNTQVYNLYSRRFYGALDKENLRNRRRQSAEMIHTRLVILDFVLAHRDENYLETEPDKVQYFTRQLNLPITALPARTYFGIKSVSNTQRYFVDRFPIFIPAPGNRLGLAPVVTFTYCDTPGSSLFAYLTHLRHYEPLLRPLSDFNFVFASAEPHKFERAKAFFTHTFPTDMALNGRRLRRYFEIRKLWDTQHTAELTRADRDFLRDGLQLFKAQKYETAYQKWAAQSLPEGEIRALISGLASQNKGAFHTYLLPESYPIFSTESNRDYKKRGKTLFSISSSPACEA